MKGQTGGEKQNLGCFLSLEPQKVIYFPLLAVVRMQILTSLLRLLLFEFVKAVYLRFCMIFYPLCALTSRANVRMAGPPIKYLEIARIEPRSSQS